jgi:DnaA family protein
VSPQLPLALKFPPDQRFAGFVGQPELRALVEVVAQARSDECLYLAGAAGSGKTHLLLAACAEAQQCGQRARYLPLASMAGRLAEALDGGIDASLACLDGLEAIAGIGDDEIALFHFHNRARAAGIRLVYAATAMPIALSLGLPDLASRLSQCTRLALEPLSDEGRREVLRQRAVRRGLELDEAVLDYLFRRMGRDLATLTVLIDRLDRASLAAQRRVTVPFLRGVLDAAGA